MMGDDASPAAPSRTRGIAVEEAQQGCSAGGQQPLHKDTCDQQHQAPEETLPPHSPPRPPTGGDSTLQITDRSSGSKGESGNTQ